jgi:hypothetical protein
VSPLQPGGSAAGVVARMLLLRHSWPGQGGRRVLTKGLRRLAGSRPARNGSLDGDDDLPSNLPGLQVADRLGNVAEGERPVNDRCELFGFDELLQ